MNRITSEIFLQKSGNIPIIDVRAPVEYMAGHVPGAINLPIFDDDERKVIGTLYKNSGRLTSVMKGMEIVGPKLVDFVKQAQKISPGKKVIIYCWRGGLRSQNMGWVLFTAGFEVDILEGGYKAYRRFVREQLGTYNSVIVLGGKTGSGKTDILISLEKLSAQVINLEFIANHKGSAFGDLGQDQQPSNEQFENNLYQHLTKLDSSKPIWVEDESRAIGRVSIPNPFYRIIRESKIIFVDMPKSERIKRLVKEYAHFSKKNLRAGILRIAKKLGGLNMKLAIESLDLNDYDTVADILLYYYDKAYLQGLSLRDEKQIDYLSVEHDIPDENAKKILELYGSI